MPEPIAFAYTSANSLLTRARATWTSGGYRCTYLSCLRAFAGRLPHSLAHARATAAYCAVYRLPTYYRAAGRPLSGAVITCHLCVVAMVVLAIDTAKTWRAAAARLRVLLPSPTAYNAAPTSLVFFALRGFCAVRLYLPTASLTVWLRALARTPRILPLLLSPSCGSTVKRQRC